MEKNRNQETRNQSIKHTSMNPLYTDEMNEIYYRHTRVILKPTCKCEREARNTMSCVQTKGLCADESTEMKEK